MGFARWRLWFWAPAFAGELEGVGYASDVSTTPAEAGAQLGRSQ